MTALYIGGAAQGKHALARKTHPQEEIIDALQEQVRQALEQGRDPMQLLEQVRGKIIICQEVGCGLIPLAPADRQWREAVGRLCCAIAQEATLVVRVVAGCAQVLKGTLP